MTDVQTWNATYPAGTPVTHCYSDGTGVETETESDAFTHAGIPSIFLVHCKRPVALRAVKPRTIIPPPTIDDIRSAISAVLPKLPEGFGLTVRLTLVDENPDPPQAFVDAIHR